MGDEQPETMMVHLSRQDSGQSWGFRLQGGMDFNTPLSVQVVQPRSVAERCGLKAGDGIIRINQAMTDGLSHEQAKMEIIRSCNDIDMLIMRGAVQIWRPKVTPMNELKPENKPQPIQTATGDQIYANQRTSLAKDKQDEDCTIGSAYNRSAKPFPGSRGPAQQHAPPPQQQPQYGGGQPQYGGGQPQGQYGGGQGQPQYGGGQPQYGGQPQSQGQYGGQPAYGNGQPQYGQGPEQPTYGGGQGYGRAPDSPKKAVPNVVHAQFNSPIGLYSAGNIANSYTAQTAGIQKQMENLDVGDAPVGLKMTGTYQRLDSNDSSGTPPRTFGTAYGSQASPPQGDDPVPNSDPDSGSYDPNPSVSTSSLQITTTSTSCERLQPAENGVLSQSDEHVTSDDTNTFINSNPSGFRSVCAPTATSNPAPPPKAESMHCTGCGEIVSGVFVRIKGMPYHDKCFKCARCGVFLKQKGYFIIDGQLLCDIHARQAQPPPDNMKFAGTVYR